jgi:metallophosphoesterase (TIGR00282 family)
VNNTVNLLLVGDIVGKSGRRAITRFLKQVCGEYEIDFVIANGENAAGGMGLTQDVACELFGRGVHVLTSGNHIWDKKDIYGLIDEEPRLLRPANYPPGVPGLGLGFYVLGDYHIGVINLLGRVFIHDLDCPFRCVDALLEEAKAKTNIIVVDFHGEATAEKCAMGWYLDGRVSAVFGTHTHVQTNDARILPGGTAYISDVGMCGARDGVLGFTVDPIIGKFKSGLPTRFEVAKGSLLFCALVVRINPETGLAESTTTISLTED